MKFTSLFCIFLSLLLLVACAAKRPPTTAELIKQKKYAEAEKNLQGAVMNLHFDPERALLLGLVYQKTGRTPLAKRIYLDILEQSPNTIMVNDIYPGFDQRPVGALAKYLLAQIDAKPKHAKKARPETFRSATVRLPEKNKKRRTGKAHEQVMKSGAPGKYYGVHLASFKRALNVEPAAQKFRTQFPGLFRNKQFRTRRLDFGQKGVFHRLIVGPYPTKRQARDVCRKVKKIQRFCDVVRF